MEKPVKQLFIDYIRNTCTQQELDQVLLLIRQGGHEQEWMEAMEEVESFFAAQDSIDSEIDEEGMFRQIELRTGIRHFPWRWLAYAASVIVLLGIGFIAVNSSRKTPELATLPSKLSLVAADSVHKWLKLPDGSSVHLNDSSRLEFPDSFDGMKKREVRLIGEAYFEVKYDPLHPFIIHTGKIRTVVLGTAFNISARRADKAVVVTVTHGKVKVEDDQKTLAILSPDQQLEWTPQQSNPVKVAVNSAVATEWKKTDLIMDDITLGAAAELISAHFGVKVRFNDEQVKSVRFTAAFLKRNDIAQVLEVIGQTTGARLRLVQNTVTIDRQK